MKAKILIVLISFFAISNEVQSQRSDRDSLSAIHTFGFSGGLQFPFGDLSERFGVNGSAGFSYYYKTKSNLLIGAEGNLIFGANVKNSNELASEIRTPDGFFIDNQGLLATVLIQERGLDIRLVAGKIFPVFGPNPNSGLLIKFGAGFLQHRIRFEARENEVPQIEGEAQKGYDRLSNGLSISQFIGYHHYGNRNRINFSVGLEFIEAFTQSRRDYNIDLMRRDDANRLDGLVGLRATWIIPIYQRASDKYYIY